jgi:hypothetical protein
MIAGVFPEVVSLIEWAEQLRVWGAAPEQRLALYFRRLPSVRRRMGLVPAAGGCIASQNSVVCTAAGWRAAIGSTPQQLLP